MGKITKGAWTRNAESEGRIFIHDTPLIKIVFRKFDFPMNLIEIAHSRFESPFNPFWGKHLERSGSFAVQTGGNETNGYLSTRGLDKRPWPFPRRKTYRLPFSSPRHGKQSFVSFDSSKNQFRSVLKPILFIAFR